MLRTELNWKGQYRAFQRILERDCPYPLDDCFNREVQDIFQGVYEQLIFQHSKIKDFHFSRDGKGIVDLISMDHFLLLCFRLAHALFKTGTMQYERFFVYWIPPSEVYFKLRVIKNNHADTH